MKNLFSIEDVRMSASEVWMKYPVTLLYCVLLSFVIMSLIHNAYDDKLIQGLAVYASTGVFASLGMEWCRRVYDSKIVKRVAIAIHVVLLSNALYFINCIESASKAFCFDEFVIYGLCCVLPFVLPFFKDKTDICQWHFVRKFCLNALLSTLIVSLLQIGLLFLFACLNMLFNCDIDRISADSSIALWIVGWPMIQLMRTNMVNEVRLGRASDIFSTFVLRTFMGLLIAYQLLLVVYFIRIALAWELPDGNVALPVSCMMVLLIVVKLMAYGVAQSKRRIDGKVLRVVVYIALLPLVLMSIAIARRVMDYGITPARVYLIVLNVWFYAVSLYFMRWNRIKLQHSAFPERAGQLLILLVAVTHCGFAFQKYY